MTDVEIRPFRPGDEGGIVELWEACGLVVPWNNPHTDIRRKISVQPDWLLVGVTRHASDNPGGSGEGGGSGSPRGSSPLSDSGEARLVGTVMVGYDGHRGWINYLAVHPGRRNTGLGRCLMDEAERVLRDAGCPKINLQVRSSNAGVISFYTRLGFKVEDILNLGKRLESDD